LRIVHIGTGFLPVSADADRSVETTIYQLTQHLALSGHEVHVLDMATGPRARSDTTVRFHRVHSLPLPGSTLAGYSLKVVCFSVSLLPGLRRLVRDGGADMVHAHSQFPAAAVLIARRLFRWHIPVVYTAHNPYLLAQPGRVNRLKHLLLEGWVLRRVDRVLAQTRTVASELVRRFRVNPERVSQVFAGIDTEMISRFAQEHPAQRNGHHTVLCPAIINPRKNQMAVVEGIPDILKMFPRCRFVFAGRVDDRDYFDRIQARLDEHHVGGCVEFTGHLPRETLYRRYLEATVFVFPTLYESQGLVLLEAMAFGLPVIASRIGPIEDVVSLHEGSAVLVDPADTGELGRAIVDLLQDGERRKQLSTHGKELAFSRFSWSRTAQDTLTAYQHVLREANPD